jgi:3-oxoacyl-[acyl-carrier protein] reductase
VDFGLQGKTAFIAGSSKGIGLGIAKAFAREGANIVLTGRTPEPLENARREAADIAGEDSKVLVFQGDMTKRDDIGSAMAESIAQFGGIDVVVANIGGGGAKGVVELSDEDWKSVFEVNLFGSAALASIAPGHLIGRAGASLIFVSSIAGWETINAPVTYGAAKAALHSVMKALSRTLGPQGVRVNAVVPGNVLFPGGSWEKELAQRRDVFDDYIQSEVPLQRFGTPDEIGDAVVFLSSARAAFITGACLVVDGGQTRSW